MKKTFEEEPNDDLRPEYDFGSMKVVARGEGRGAQALQPTADSRGERDAFRVRNAAKCGDFTGEDCPNCKKARLMRGNDGKSRCEQCAWCVEDANYDSELYRYLHGNI